LGPFLTEKFNQGSYMEYTKEELVKAYRLMKSIREFEERMRSEYQQGKLPGFIHIYRNQEPLRLVPAST